MDYSIGSWIRITDVDSGETQEGSIIRHFGASIILQCSHGQQTWEHTIDTAKYRYESIPNPHVDADIGWSEHELFEIVHRLDRVWTGLERKQYDDFIGQYTESDSKRKTVVLLKKTNNQEKQDSSESETSDSESSDTISSSVSSSDTDFKEHLKPDSNITKSEIKKNTKSRINTIVAKPKTNEKSTEVKKIALKSKSKLKVVLIPPPRKSTKSEESSNASRKPSSLLIPLIPSRKRTQPVMFIK